MPRETKNFLRNNGLSILMFGLFVVFTIGVSFTGWTNNNETLKTHGQPQQTYTGYITSGEFIEAIFENWESEFLQMAALVIATIFLYQRGSADSKKLRGPNEVDTSSRYSIIRGDPSDRIKAAKELLRSNALGLALITLFLFSFALHAVGGAAAHNSEAAAHGEPAISVMTYIRTAQFWFESFQNWQSEFLAVGTLLVLSIYLRQRGSPESKPIGESNRRTGS
jgi:amino acid transporter